MCPINQIYDGIMSVATFALVINIIIFLACSAIIIFFTPSKSEADDNRKFIMAVVSFILIVTMCAMSAVKN